MQYDEFLELFNPMKLRKLDILNGFKCIEDTMRQHLLIADEWIEQSRKRRGSGSDDAVGVMELLVL